MGGISSLVCGRKPIPVNLAGVSGSGKTMILYKYKFGLDQPLDVIHTIGYNLEVITYKNRSFEVMDFGGGDKIQNMLCRMWANKPILIFVVDAADRIYVSEAKDRLYCWLFENKLDDLVILVFANKQDLPNAMSKNEIIEHLKLKDVKYRWHVQPCSAIEGKGITEGLEWLHEQLL